MCLAFVRPAGCNPNLLVLADDFPAKADLSIYSMWKHPQHSSACGSDFVVVPPVFNSEIRVGSQLFAGLALYLIKICLHRTMTGPN